MKEGKIWSDLCLSKCIANLPIKPDQICLFLVPSRTLYMYLMWNLWLCEGQRKIKNYFWKGNELFCTIIRISLYHKRNEIAPFSSTIWNFHLLIILALLNLFSYLPVPALKFNNGTPWALELEAWYRQLRLIKRIRIINTVLQWFFISNLWGG